MLWNNENRLNNLKIKFDPEKDILFFETADEKVDVMLQNNDIERVVISKKQNDKKIVVNKSDRKHIVVGKDNFKRDVYHYLLPNSYTKELRLGITKHIGQGTWSSLPHPFELNVEKGFEEVFFYILKGGTERALQVGKGMWPDGQTANDVWFVYNKTLSSIPMGYHPVVGEPEVSVSYVWAYLAKKQEWEKI